MVHFADAAAGADLAAVDQAAPFQLVQGGVKGAFGRRAEPPGELLDFLGENIAVGVLVPEGAQDKETHRALVDQGAPILG